MSEDNTFRRKPDFISLYANNVRFETSLFDLKLIFGQLDQREERSAVDQHSSVTISWLQAKLMAYYLEVNLAIYEGDYGKIDVPFALVPARLDHNSPEYSENKVAKLTVEYLEYIHRRYFGGPVPSTETPTSG